MATAAHTSSPVQTTSRIYKALMDTGRKDIRTAAH